MRDAHILPTTLALLFDQPRVLLLHDCECRELCTANDHLGGFHHHLGGFGGSLLSHRCQDDLRWTGTARHWLLANDHTEGNMRIRKCLLVLTAVMLPVAS